MGQLDLICKKVSLEVIVSRTRDLVDLLAEQFRVFLLLLALLVFLLLVLWLTVLLLAFREGGIA